MTRLIPLLVLALYIVFPHPAEAAVSFKVFVSMLIGAANSAVVPLLFAFAVLFFLFGVFKYFILGGESEKDRGEGKKFILWGLLALALMVSAFGLVRIFMNTFGL